MRVILVWFVFLPAALIATAFVVGLRLRSGRR
jgi:hypothetical protein